MKFYCKNKHWKINEDYNLDKILYLLIDKPTRINHWNDFVWKNEKSQWHRDYDLPVYVESNGQAAWYKNDILNRENNKPVRIFYND